MELQTPSLLFGSISLILLAYSNRFHTLASLIRTLNASRDQERRAYEIQQIPLLRTRLSLVKYMQAFGVLSFLLCTTSLFFLFLKFPQTGKTFFVISVISLMVSLALSLWEVVVSTKALDLILMHCETDKK